MTIALQAAALAASLCLANAQTPDPSPVFEVASVKPTTFPRPDARGNLVLVPSTGGPGSADPGRVHYPYATLRSLLLKAYDVKSFQISGPDWLDTDRFDVAATLPPSTTPAEFRIMVRNLLAQRFGLTLHSETRESKIYTLVVAKGGAKLKESGDARLQDEPVAASGGPILLRSAKAADDGFPANPFPSRRPGILTLFAHGQARIVASRQTMHEFAEHLTTYFECPVTDATGLAPRYDFVVNFTPDVAANPGGDTADVQPGLFAALQSQLGLRLDVAKGAIEFLVIDHVERTPTAN